MQLILPWPPSVNTYWRPGPRGMYMTAAGRDYRENALRQFKDYDFPVITEKCTIKITAWPPDRRVRDLDNILKPILDLLEHAGVVKNDNQFDDIHIRRGEIEKFGQIYVEIEPSPGLVPCYPSA